MSVTFLSQNQRNAPNQATIQKMLDENVLLIKTIVDYQSKGKASECEQQQHILHRNLVYLASVADANVNLLPPQQQQQHSGQPARHTSPMPQNITSGANAQGGIPPGQYNNTHQSGVNPAQSNNMPQPVLSGSYPPASQQNYGGQPLVPPQQSNIPQYNRGQNFASQAPVPSQPTRHSFDSVSTASAPSSSNDMSQYSIVPSNGSVISQGSNYAGHQNPNMFSSQGRDQEMSSLQLSQSSVIQKQGGGFLQSNSSSAPGPNQMVATGQQNFSSQRPQTPMMSQVLPNSVMSQSHQSAMISQSQQSSVLSQNQQNIIISHGQQNSIMLHGAQQSSMMSQGQQNSMMSQGPQNSMMSQGMQNPMMSQGQQNPMMAQGQHNSVMIHGGQQNSVSQGLQNSMGPQGQQNPMMSHASQNSQVQQMHHPSPGHQIMSQGQPNISQGSQNHPQNQIGTMMSHQQNFMASTGGMMAPGQQNLPPHGQMNINGTGATQQNPQIAQGTAQNMAGFQSQSGQLQQQIQQNNAVSPQGQLQTPQHPPYSDVPMGLSSQPSQSPSANPQPVSTPQQQPMMPQMNIAAPSPGMESISRGQMPPPNTYRRYTPSGQTYMPSGHQPSSAVYHSHPAMYQSQQPYATQQYAGQNQGQGQPQNYPTYGLHQQPSSSGYSYPSGQSARYNPYGRQVVQSSNQPSTAMPGSMPSQVVGVQQQPQGAGTPSVGHMVQQNYNYPQGSY